MKESVGQVQRLYTEHPIGRVKRESALVRNYELKASQISSQVLIPAALTQWRCENPPKRGTLNSNETSGMPKIGDVKTASELGYRGHAIYQYSACRQCGKERWVRVLELEKGKGLVCRSCGYSSTEYHQQKIRGIRILGAKRASELGKPLPKSRKRDPWYYEHQCSICGANVWHQKRDLHRACSPKCGHLTSHPKGANHPNWKGGRYYHGDGYIIVQVPTDSLYYPMAHGRGYILEHRLIMAQYLGRCLLDSEVVHHKGIEYTGMENKQDNRIENLELLPNDASHLPYIRLQQQVMKLEQEVKLLQWHIREIEHGNPVARRESDNVFSDVRRDYTGGILDND